MVEKKAALILLSFCISLLVVIIFVSAFCSTDSERNQMFMCVQVKLGVQIFSLLS